MSTSRATGYGRRPRIESSSGSTLRRPLPGDLPRPESNIVLSLVQELRRSLKISLKQTYCTIDIDRRDGQMDGCEDVRRHGMVAPPTGWPCRSRPWLQTSVVARGIQCHQCKQRLRCSQEPRPAVGCSWRDWIKPVNYCMKNHNLLIWLAFFWQCSQKSCWNPYLIPFNIVEECCRQAPHSTTPHLGGDEVALAPVGGFAHVQLLSQAVELALHFFAALVSVDLAAICSHYQPETTPSSGHVKDAIDIHRLS